MTPPKAQSPVCADSAGASGAPNRGARTKARKGGDSGKLPATAADLPPRTAASLPAVFAQVTYTRQHTARAMTPAEHVAWAWTRSPQTDDDILAQFLDRWRVDPVLFAFEAARYSLMPYQAQALLDLADAPAECYAFYGLDPNFPKGKVLLPSGHGLGKTTLVALAIWWHKICHKASKQLATAPTSDQLTGQLMGEARKIYRQLASHKLGKLLAADWDLQGSGIVHKDPQWKDWQTMLRTARPDQPEALQGGHALDAIDPYGDLAAIWGADTQRTAAGGILIVFEEASGIPDEIRQTLQGSLSERGARMIAPGNPTRADGWFAEQCQQGDLYAVHHLDCRLSDLGTVYSLPYKPPGRPVTQVRTHGFVSQDYWRGILAECDGDENADYFRVRVRGLPPTSNVTQVLRAEWVDQALERPPDEDSYREPVVLGADFGLTADKHALAAVQGHNCLDLIEWLIPHRPDEQLDSAFLRIVEWQDQYGARYIVGDSNGVGAGVMSQLSTYFSAPERRHLGVNVIHFQAGKQAINASRFARRRSEMWYVQGRAWLSHPRCHLPKIPGLKAQLVAPGFTEDERRIIQVESKKDIRKRTGLPSGNAADALLMTQMIRTEPAPLPGDAPKPTPMPEAFRRHFRRLDRERASADLIV